MSNTNFLHCKNNYLKNLITICFVFLGTTLFLIPLVLTWCGKTSRLLQQSYYSALLGVLPWSDATGYYHGALEYLESGLLPIWNLRRPIHTLLFSSELFLMHKNFWHTMILHVFMCGLSCSLASYAVRKILGKTAGVIFLTTSLILTLAFIPTTLTETTGVALGMLAFIFLWTGYVERKTLTFSFGILILTLALHARAGAFLILPCMIFLATFDFTKSTKPRLRLLIFSCILIIIATFAIVLLQKIWGNTPNQMHANFSYTLFGIVSGGKGWKAAYELYPSLSSMSEAETASFLYKESFKIFLHNPLLLFSGIFRSLGGFVNYHMSFFLTPQRINNIWWLKIPIRTIGFAFICFCLYALRHAYTNQYLHRITKFVIAGFIGIVLSSLIIWTDGRIRVFAATYSFWAVALSLVAVSYNPPKNTAIFNLDISHNKAFLYTKLAAIILLGYYLTLIFILPFFTHWQKTDNSLPTFSSEKRIVIAQNITKSPYMVVHPSENNFSNHGLREITHKKYEKVMVKSGCERYETFTDIANKQYPNSSFVIFSTMDLLTHEFLYILSNPNILQNTSPFLKLKGKFIRPSGFFIVQSYQPFFYSS